MASDIDKLLHFTADNMATIDLLWENASIESQFAAQTLSLDISQYDMIMIDIGYWNSSISKFQHGSSFFGVVGEQMYINGIHTWKFATRPINVNNNSLEISNCTVHNTYGNSSGTVTNQALKPIKIYGIKGV